MLVKFSSSSVKNFGALFDLIIQSQYKTFPALIIELIVKKSRKNIQGEFKGELTVKTVKNCEK